ncbi:MAG: hypothetical protein AB7H80_04360 [Candidatus Kapaibacterium sp.]
MAHRALLSTILFLLFSAASLTAQLSSDINWVKGKNIVYPVVPAQSEDGRYVAAVNASGEFMVWEDGFSQQLFTLTLPIADTPTISFSRNSNVVVVGAGDMLYFIDLPQKKLATSLQLGESDLSALISIEDRKMLAIHSSGTVHEIDPLSRTLITTWSLPISQLRSFRVMNNNSTLLFIDSTDRLRGWNLNTKELLPVAYKIDPHRTRFSASAGSSSVVVYTGSSLSVINVETMDTLYSEYALPHQSWGYSVCISYSGDSLLYFDGYKGGILHDIKADYREEIDFGLFSLKGPIPSSVYIIEVDDAVRLDFSSDGKRVLMNVYRNYTYATAGYQLLLYDFRKPGVVEYPSEAGGAGYVLPSDSTVVVSSYGVVSVATGKLLSPTYVAAEEHYRHYSRNGVTAVYGDETFESGLSGTMTVSGPYKNWVVWDHYDYPPYPSDVSPDGRYVIVEGYLHFADSSFDKRKVLIPGFYRARFAYDGYHFAAWNKVREEVNIWDCREVAVVKTIPLSGVPNVVEFSKTSELIAVGYTDGGIEIYNVLTGELLTSLNGHRGSINDLSFTRHDQFLVSAGEDSTVRTWSLATGLNDYTYSSWPAAQQSVSTTSDGKYIITSAEDNTTICWHGRGEISSVEETDEPTAQFEATIVPNPVDGSVATLQCRVEESGELQVEILNTRGEVVRATQFSVEGGSVDIPLQTGDLVGGGYFCRVHFRSVSGHKTVGSWMPLVVVR